MSRLLAISMFCLLGNSSDEQARAQGLGNESPIRLSDVTPQTGITFKHTDGSSGKWHMIEPMTGGVALFDYDRDGLVDIYFLNGAPLKGVPSDSRPTNALYRNEGRFRFTEVTTAAGVGDRGFGLGVAAADYDNDGHTDLFVNNYGPNVLYRNNGDGTFADVTKKAGVAGGHLAGAGANFLDIDNDGDLDLFVANYVLFSDDTEVTSRVLGRRIYAGPRDYPKCANMLYRNNGDGTFTDISNESGIGNHKGSGMGTVAADYDNDGDTDIIVANDDWGNFLFQNDGNGRFTEVGLLAGIAYDLSGDAQSSMGVACGDYNNDGRLDLHITSYQREMATLYKNLGQGLFEDATRLSGAGTGTFQDVTWGNGLVDLDNDGRRDLMIVAGHLQENIGQLYHDASYLAKNILLHNKGNGTFANVSEHSGKGLTIPRSSRGAAFDDLDNDGDLDVVVLNSCHGPTILRNETPLKHHWITIVLRGTEANRDGIGARVTVVAGDLTLVSEAHSGQGYQSHFGTRLHFGLGNHAVIDRIEVRWPGGHINVARNVAPDRFVTITERHR